MEEGQSQNQNMPLNHINLKKFNQALLDKPNKNVINLYRKRVIAKV